MKSLISSSIVQYAVALMLSNGDVPRDDAAAFKHFNVGSSMNIYVTSMIMEETSL
jgi:hypothetical protein